MSSSSEASAARRLSQTDLPSERDRLADGLATEWEITINTFAWLGEQLSASAVIQKSQMDIALLQLFDVLHQQIRALSTLTVHLAQATTTDDTEAWVSRIESIPFSDIRERLLACVDGDARKREHVGVNGAVDWL